MKRLTIVIIAMIIVLILVVPISLWFLVFDKPIKAAPEDMILTTSDIPGWEPSETTGGYGWFGHPPEQLSEATMGYYNQSTAYSISITVKSFYSSTDAHQFYSSLDVHTLPSRWLNQSVKDTSESIVTNFPMEVQNQSNYSQFLTAYCWYYDFRIENVVVIIEYRIIPSNQSAIIPPTQEWMDQIVSVQVQKIQQFNIHLRVMDAVMSAINDAVDNANR